MASPPLVICPLLCHSAPCCVASPFFARSLSTGRHQLSPLAPHASPVLPHARVAMWHLLVSQPSAPSSCAGPGVHDAVIPLFPYVLAKTLISLYGLICILSLVSLLRIICHHHKVYSFRFFFLLLSFTWTLLRIAFFLSSPSSPSSIPPCTPSPDPSLSDSSPTYSSSYHLLVDLLYYLPASCQLAMFSLLVLFYARLYHQHVHDWKRVERRCIGLFASLNTAMLLITITFILVIQQPTHTDDSNTSAVLELVHQGYFILSALFFLSLTLIACYYFHRLYRHTPISPSVAHHLSLSSLIFALLLSRCIFDAGAALDSSALFFRRQLYESQAGVLIELPTFLLLGVWEVLPTLLVILYFRDVATVSSQSLTATESGLMAGAGEWVRWVRWRCCCGGGGDTADGDRGRAAFSSFHPNGQSFYSEVDAAGRGAYGGLAEDEEAEAADAFYYDVDAAQLEETDEERKGRQEHEDDDRRDEQEQFKSLSVFSPYSSSLLSLSSSPSHPLYPTESELGYQMGAHVGNGGTHTDGGGNKQQDGRGRNGNAH